jgi:nucleotide-binding universal stress UspA family protein
MFQRILIATDGSTLSRKAVASGIALAAQHGADLVALTVVPRYPKAYFDGAMAVAAEETLAAVATRAKRSGVKVKTVAVSSDLVAESIVAAAKKHKCDLIVMASHGRKGIKRLLLGSETQHVLTHSTLPVLVLR